MSPGEEKGLPALPLHGGGGTGVTPAALSGEDPVPQPRVRAKAPGRNRGLASASADLGQAELGCSSTTGSSEASPRPAGRLLWETGGLRRCSLLTGGLAFPWVKAGRVAPLTERGQSARIWRRERGASPARSHRGSWLAFGGRAVSRSDAVSLLALPCLSGANSSCFVGFFFKCVQPFSKEAKELGNLLGNFSWSLLVF